MVHIGNLLAALCLVCIQTILTNGVSFSLVAGACCVIIMQYPILGNYGYKTAWTLNIQSTGAKACIFHVGSVSDKNATSISTLTSNVQVSVNYMGSGYLGTTSNGYWETNYNHPVSSDIFAIYNGSSYVIINSSYGIYLDYNDAD